MKFIAFEVWRRKKWYLLLSYGLVHEGWGHLLFNMLPLYFFGAVIERYFAAAFRSPKGIVLYPVLYVSALAVSTVGDLIEYRDDYNYKAAGASGAIYGILFLLVCDPAIFGHFLTQLQS